MEYIKIKSQRKRVIKRNNCHANSQPQLTQNRYGAASRVILVPDLIRSTDRLDLLQPLGRLSDIDEDLTAQVQNKAVAPVHRRDGQWDLSHADVLLALDLEQPFLTLGICLHLVKATGHATRQVTDSVLVVAEEQLRLVILHFPVLDGGSVQHVVQLDSHNGCRTRLILCRLGAQPEVDVPREVTALVLFGLCGGIEGEVDYANYLHITTLLTYIQHDVGVALVELAIVILGIHHRFKVL